MGPHSLVALGENPVHVFLQLLVSSTILGISWFADTLLWYLTPMSYVLFCVSFLSFKNTNHLGLGPILIENCLILTWLYSRLYIQINSHSPHSQLLGVKTWIDLLEEYSSTYNSFPFLILLLSSFLPSFYPSHTLLHSSSFPLVIPSSLLFPSSPLPPLTSLLVSFLLFTM